ncbi:tryptophan aminotransferase-related protein 2-like [Trifolium pratense]|uniref:Tryptophan aminotransferase-related protein 2-like n=1 Tax=Trifolium pratense TaxID=57577 RepID=A0A2K3JQK5_TRIPR|nr:tryptophan aminotransferase-related protein 2-like [Trifolium pratense]
MVPQMRDAILSLHNVVGNAVTKDKFLVLGTGSSQLYQTLLYALSPSEPSRRPVNVVVATPYYSEYKDATDILQSRLFQWTGDAALYDKDESHIEVVTSPNNLDGTLELKGKQFITWPITGHNTLPLLMNLTMMLCSSHSPNEPVMLDRVLG